MMCKRCHGDGFEYQIDSDGFCDNCGSFLLRKREEKPESKPQDDVVILKRMESLFDMHNGDTHITCYKKVLSAYDDLKKERDYWKIAHDQNQAIGLEIANEKEVLKKENQKLREALVAITNPLSKGRTVEYLIELARTALGEEK